jgi:hypothetical protein
MHEHQVVLVGHQFKDGVTFMTVTTPHLLNNLARADNCKFQTQGHIDGELIGAAGILHCLASA